MSISAISLKEKARMLVRVALRSVDISNGLLLSAITLLNIRGGLPYSEKDDDSDDGGALLHSRHLITYCGAYNCSHRFDFTLRIFLGCASGIRLLLRKIKSRPRQSQVSKSTYHNIVVNVHCGF